MPTCSILIGGKNLANRNHSFYKLKKQKNMNTAVGIDENLLRQSTQQVEGINWALLLDPSQWYITPALIQENYLSLLASFGAVFVAFIIFMFSRSQGINSKWWKEMKVGRIRISDRLVVQMWAIFYIPLAISAWLIWIYSGKQWSRALTVYTSHLIVNVLFAVSLWWVQDLSLALLNLFTLIGVAMFTTTQFGAILQFTSIINTPYLFWLLIYTIYFCFFWYYNEGKEVLDVAALKGGKKKPLKKKTGYIPPEAKEKLKKKIEESKKAKGEKEE